MKAPAISILMAAFNAEAFVAEAIRSVVEQTRQDWELIIVDDASTDATLSLAQQYAERDERIRVVSQTENQGQAIARNRALALARGTYICMLDADDWLSPDALELALSAFAGDEVDSVVLSLVSHFPDGREEIYEMPFGAGAVVEGQEAFRLSLDWRVHGLYVVRRELHLRYPYDTTLRLYSDDNTSHLHYLHSRKVAFSDGVYHYRRRPDSTTGAISAQRFLHMHANWLLAQTLCREGVEEDVRRDYEHYRWLNYKSMLRLLHSNRKAFERVEYHRLRADFRTIYATFHRLLPFPLFECRQWMGWKVHNLM